MDYVLSTDNLVKSYGQARALSGLSMHVPKGAIYGIVFLGKPICDAIGVPLVAAVSGTALGFSGAFGICACFVAASTVCMFMVRKNKKLVAMEEEAARELQAQLAVS